MSLIARNVLFICFIVILFLVFFHREKVSEVTYTLALQNSLNSIEEFKQCYSENVLIYSNDSESLWNTYEKNSETCHSSGNIENLDIRLLDDMNNGKKWVVLPKINETTILISLGITKNLNAETTLAEAISNISFYGVDPSYESKEHFEKFGKFYPIAISGDIQNSFSRIISNDVTRAQRTLNIDFVYFLTHIIDAKKIDILWIDAKGEEFPIMKLIHSNGPLDLNGVRFCQIVMDIHASNIDEMSQFETFLRTIIEDGKYIIARSSKTESLRLFLINLKDFECTKKFVDV